MLSSIVEHLEDMGVASFCIQEIVEDESYSDDVWEWLDQIASFKHIHEKEYMVYIDKNLGVNSLKEYLENKGDLKVPEVLMPVLEEAYNQGYAYINFYPC